MFMGLYDEEGPIEEEGNNEEGIGKVIKTINKRPKAKKKKLSASSGFEFPAWLRSVLLGAGILIIVLILALVIYSSLKPQFLSTNLNKSPTYLSEGSSSTKLNVTVQNTKDYSLKNLTLNVTPIDKMSVAIVPSDEKKIGILGADEKREFTYDISTIGDVEPGDYAIKVTLDTGEETITKQIFWEIKNHK